MAVKLRLVRMGKKKQPSYRIVAADSRAPRNGRFIEVIGFYQPRQEPSVVKIDNQRALHWLQHGAQPTDRVKKLLSISGAWESFRPTEATPENATPDSATPVTTETNPTTTGTTTTNNSQENNDTENNDSATPVTTETNPTTTDTTSTNKQENNDTENSSQENNDGSVNS